MQINKVISIKCISLLLFVDDISLSVVDDISLSVVDDISLSVTQ